VSKVAVLHDSFEGYGGAEYVATKIAETFDAPIYTSIAPNEGCHHGKIISLANHIPANYVLNIIFKALLFKRLKLPEYNIIISSGNLSMFYKPRRGQKVINYCHTPMREVYDLHEITMSRFSMPKRLGAVIFFSIWRKMLENATKNVDVILCNSPIVKDRINKYWKREARVVYPPVEIENYTNNGDEGFFLYISRLYPEKRPELVIKAFQKCNRNLVMVGRGLRKYEEMAANTKNIDYRGNVDEEEKINLLARCKAVIYPPMEEDFGLVPIETFASGKPVIGIKEGFTKYQIEEERGLFAEPTPEGILKAIKQVNSKKWDSEAIVRYAKRYDISIFREELKRAIDAVVD